MAMTQNAKTRPKSAASPDRKARSKRLRGPSPNPLTNLVIADIGLQIASQLIRDALEKRALESPDSNDEIRAAIEKRSASASLALLGIGKLAASSVPGALLVGGGLALKTLVERKGKPQKQPEDKPIES